MPMKKFSELKENLFNKLNDNEAAKLFAESLKKPKPFINNVKSNKVNFIDESLVDYYEPIHPYKPRNPILSKQQVVKFIESLILNFELHYHEDNVKSEPAPEPKLDIIPSDVKVSVSEPSPDFDELYSIICPVPDELSEQDKNLVKMLALMAEEQESNLKFKEVILEELEPDNLEFDNLESNKFDKLADLLKYCPELSFINAARYVKPEVKHEDSFDLNLNVKPVSERFLVQLDINKLEAHLREMEDNLYCILDFSLEDLVLADKLVKEELKHRPELLEEFISPDLDFSEFPFHFELFKSKFLAFYKNKFSYAQKPIIIDRLKAASNYSEFLYMDEHYSMVLKYARNVEALLEKNFIKKIISELDCYVSSFDSALKLARKKNFFLMIDVDRLYYNQCVSKIDESKPSFKQVWYKDYSVFKFSVLNVVLVEYYEDLKRSLEQKLIEVSV